MDTKLLTVILAEDDDGHAELIERNLSRCGVHAELIHVKDGKAVIDLLNEQERNFADRPLLLLLDIKMPILDGIEVLAIIKKDPKLANIPVVMLTTTDDTREMQRCYEYGCNAYITKPLKYEDFIETIRSLGLFLQILELPDFADKN